MSFPLSGDFFGAAAAGFFAVPILRQWLYAIGAMPASKQDIVRRLRQKNQVRTLQPRTLTLRPFPALLLQIHEAFASLLTFSACRFFSTSETLLAV